MRLTTRDVARILRTSTDAVHKLVQGGRLKTLRRGRGRPVIYDTVSVDEERRRREEARA